MHDRTHFYVMAEKCDECLFTPNRIVPKDRVDRATHQGTPAGNTAQGTAEHRQKNDGPAPAQSPWRTTRGHARNRPTVHGKGTRTARKHGPRTIWTDTRHNHRAGQRAGTRPPRTAKDAGRTAGENGHTAHHEPTNNADRGKQVGDVRTWRTLRSGNRPNPNDKEGQRPGNRPATGGCGRRPRQASNGSCRPHDPQIAGALTAESRGNGRHRPVPRSNKIVGTLEAATGRYATFTAQETFGLARDPATPRRIRARLVTGARPKLAAKLALLDLLQENRQ
jgi:hypothetical protein